MPDTGAPWNIPYVAGTDLVADWPTDSQSLANAIDSALDIARLTGNVVQAVKTDTFTTTSSTFVDVTDLSVTITPATATNKVLLIANVMMGDPGHNDDRTASLRFTGGNADDYVGDAAGSRTRSVFGIRSLANDLNLQTATMVYLDSPATTSATTYKVEGRAQGGAGTLYVNRSGQDTDADYSIRGASSLIAIEVAA